MKFCNKRYSNFIYSNKFTYLQPTYLKDVKWAATINRRYEIYMYFCQFKSKNQREFNIVDMKVVFTEGVNIFSKVDN